MAPAPSFTLGIEEEFQVIDPETRELKSHIQEMFAEGEKRLKDEIKREMHDPVIEIGTPICQNVEEARQQVTRLRGEIIKLTRENGLRIASAGTHPISHWANVAMTSAPRYDQLLYEMQMLARANLIFGLHVHVAVEDDETRIQIMNAARYFLPHVFALSVNAPFQAITKKLYNLYSKNMGWRIYRRSLLNENKQRAARFGIGGSLIDFGKKEEVPYAMLLDELLEFVDDVVDELGSRKAVYYAREIMKNKPGADRQVAKYEERKDLRDVVDYIITETEYGIPQ